jgi:hypothetical protein
MKDIKMNNVQNCDIYKRKDPPTWEALVSRRGLVRNAGTTITEAQAFPLYDNINT